MRIDAGRTDAQDLEPFWNETADATDALSDIAYAGEMLVSGSLAEASRSIRLIMIVCQMLVRIYVPSPSIPGPEWSRRLWTASFFGTCFRIFVESNRFSFEDWRDSTRAAFAGWLIERA